MHKSSAVLQYEQRLAMGMMYKRAPRTPTMAIAMLDGVEQGRIKVKWIEHRILSYVNWLAVSEKRTEDAKQNE